MKTRNHSILFEGLVVKMEQMEVEIGHKGWHPYQVIRHPGGVATLPMHDDGTVTLIKQLRPALGQFLLEAPAGRKYPGEDPAACGRRELAEETGLVAGAMHSVGVVLTSPGVMDEVVHLFVATDLVQCDDHQEEYENIETVRVPLQEALRMALDGRISDGKTISLLLRAERDRA